jgi:hydroxymethylglutaryl-CoA reductase
MSANKHSQQVFENFSKLNRLERIKWLIEMKLITEKDGNYLNLSSDPKLLEIFENLVENLIGSFPLPLSISPNFIIDGKTYAIPMAVEETSVVAALGRTAKWICKSGKITTKTMGSSIIGQIQIAKVKNFEKLRNVISAQKENLINLSNERVVPSLVARGGGVKDIILRRVPRGNGGDMAVIHILLDPCDAMGANLINQVCEFLRQPIESLSKEKVNMCIVSNLADTKLTIAKVVISDIDEQLGDRIAEASLFAQQDRYRAVTNNKGVLNGIDPVVIATGNDWRAVEAGIHAYAARSGKYKPITHWKMQDGNLIGVLKAPIIVGTVGGVTQLHPIAEMSLRILGIKQASHLSRVIAAVGLVQNLGALRALTSEGIVRGHMRLHIKNLLMSAGASPVEFAFLRKKLEKFLIRKRKITLTDVKKMLAKIRKDNSLLVIKKEKKHGKKRL